MQCSNCGASLKSTAKICIGCGTPVPRDSHVDIGKATPASPEPQGSSSNGPIEATPTAEISESIVSRSGENQTIRTSLEPNEDPNSPSSVPSPTLEASSDPIYFTATGEMYIKDRANVAPNPPITSEPASSPTAPLRPDNAPIQSLPLRGGMSKAVVGGVIAAVVLATAGGGGYWYYQKQEAEKVIAAENQREEEASVVAEAQHPGTLRVKTDKLLADINLKGGDIVRLALLRQGGTPVKKASFAPFAPRHTFAAQSGLIGPGLPTHLTMYSAPASEYALMGGQEKLQVRLEAPGPLGVKTVKTLTFHRGSYLIDVGYEIINGSATPLAAHAYFQFVRDGAPPTGDPKMVITYADAAIYTAQEKLHKLLFSDLDKEKANFPKTADNGWIAMLQHYFVAAWLPKQGSQREYYAKALADKRYSVGVILPVAAIAPNASGSVSISLYAGPRKRDALKSIAPGLDLIVD